jgi:hypothetical protein
MGRNDGSALQEKLDWGVQVSRGDILNADGHPAAAVRMTGGEGQGQTVQRPNRCVEKRFFAFTEITGE